MLDRYGLVLGARAFFIFIRSDLEKRAVCFGTVPPVVETLRRAEKVNKQRKESECSGWYVE